LALIFQPVALETFLEEEEFLQLVKPPATIAQESTTLMNCFFIIRT